jgi:hypothetical protein
MSDLLGFGHITISSTSPPISINHDRQRGPTTLGISLRNYVEYRTVRLTNNKSGQSEKGSIGISNWLREYTEIT